MEKVDNNDENELIVEVNNVQHVENTSKNHKLIRNQGIVNVVKVVILIDTGQATSWFVLTWAITQVSGIAFSARLGETFIDARQAILIKATTSVSK